LDNNALEQIILNLIELKQEGGYWDFKREWHKNKNDLLHDIICMANNLENKDCFIIIGVDKSNNFAIKDIKNDLNRKNTQKMVDFLRDKNFAGGLRPTVYVESILIGETTIDVIIIKNDCNTPYYLIKNYDGVNANNIYTRVMDTNTPIDKTADIDKVEYLWRKHFRLDESPLERVKYYLSKPKDWINSPTESSSIEYYKYAPEFTIEHIYDESKNGYDFFIFAQTNYQPRWYNIIISYHQTIIFSYDGISLDSAWYFTIAPDIDGIALDNQNGWDIRFQYFIKNSLEYIIHQYFYKNDNNLERASYKKFIKYILVFETEKEKEDFKLFIQTYKNKFKELVNKKISPYVPKIKWLDEEVFKTDFRNALALQDMLEEFRLQNN